MADIVLKNVAGVEDTYSGVNKISVKQTDGSERIFVDSASVQDNFELNLAFGDTAPEDTTKLWVKSDTPSNVIVTPTALAEEGVVGATGVLLPAWMTWVRSASVGTKIYIFGGYNDDNNVDAYLDTIVEFDTGTNTITTLDAKLPHACNPIAVAAVDNKIYMFGGTDADNFYSEVVEFSTETKTCKILNVSLPTWNSNNVHGVGHATAVVGKKIYFFGGRLYGYSTNIASAFIFDTETGSFKWVHEGIPLSGSHMAAAAVGKYIYIFGRYYYYNTFYNSQNSIMKFDTETEACVTLDTKMYKPLHGATATAIGDKIYVIGGRSKIHNGSGGDVIQDTIQVFDTTDETMISLDITLPAAIQNHNAHAIGSQIYILGGNGSSGGTRGINVFSIKVPLLSGTLHLHTSNNGEKFTLVRTSFNTVEAGFGACKFGNTDGYAEDVEARLYYHEEGINRTKYFTDNCVETTAGTELSASVACSVGNLVVAAIVTRDTLILSDGWTLISTSDINSADTTNGQRLSFAYKYAESETETITVTQASEQRLYINMVALPGATGFIDNGYTYANSEISSLTASKPTGLTLWACSAPIWSTSTKWEASNNTHCIGIGGGMGTRLAIFLDQTEDESVTFASGTTETTMIVGSLTIKGIDAFYHDEHYSGLWKAI